MTAAKHNQRLLDKAFQEKIRCGENLLTAIRGCIHELKRAEELLTVNNHVETFMPRNLMNYLQPVHENYLTSCAILDAMMKIKVD